MKTLVRILAITLVLAAIGLFWNARLTAKCKEMVVGADDALAKMSAGKSHFTFGIVVAKALIRLEVKADKTVLTVDEARIANPDPYKTYGKSVKVQYQGQTRILYAAKGQEEVQVSILPLSTPKPKGVKLLLGKLEYQRLPGNTDTTYRFVRWIRTKERIYEIAQEVELERLPKLFEAAVKTFKEGQ